MNFNGSTVLVAGASGFIGTSLTKRLAEAGAHIRATVHEKPLRFSHAAIEPISVDLRRPEDCRMAVAGTDYVFMCAANTSGAAVIRLNPLAHVTPNVVMNAQILEAAHQAGVKKFLFISSGAAYPPTGNRPIGEDEMFDAEPFEGYFSAAWMKRYAEILCRTYAEKIANPMPTVIVRPSNIFGPFDKFDYRTSHVTAALVRRVVERLSPLDVWGNGEDVRDLIYIDDFIDGLLAAFWAADRHLVVNICAGQGYSVKEVLAKLLQVDGFNDADVRFDPSKPTTIPVRLMDASRARTLLQFQPRVSLEEGLKRTLAWYRANPHVERAG